MTNNSSSNTPRLDGDEPLEEYSPDFFSPVRPAGQAMPSRNAAVVRI